MTGPAAPSVPHQPSEIPMADPEIIDLTKSPTLPTNTVAQEPTPKPLSVTHDAVEQESDKKKLRKRKRKKSGKSGTQSQNTTAANTRSNSELRDDEDNEERVEEMLHNSRQVRRKQEDDTRTKENEASSSPRTFATRLRNDAPSLELMANGNAVAGDLFFMDVSPAALPPAVGNLPPPTFGVTASSSKSADEQKLLLPAHVSVLGSTPVEILPPTESDEEGDTDYIKYLDYEGDDRREFLRYFQEPEDDSVKLKRTVCKKCGAEGDHKTADCRVLICLTCGARDEHVTRSCPVSKVCFSCGMKGHIISNCPNRHMARTRDHGNSSHCNRCRSDLHGTNECPTWWRLYLYVSEEHRSQILTERRSKRDLGFGKGGEGYIAEDAWCYNCGEVGHWGDDCQGPTRYDKPAEPSAFGLSNASTGPFHDHDEPGAPVQLERRLRDWEREDQDWSERAPDNVGRQGKRKMMEKMKKHAQRLEEGSDSEDWFVRSRHVGGHNGGNHGLLNSREERDQQRSRDRERRRGMDRERGPEKRDRDRGRDGDRDRDRDRDRNRRRERDAERNGERQRDRERGWRGEKEREREQERRQEGNRDQDHGRNYNQDTINKGESGKVKISISKTIGEGRKFLPPPSLPARPPSPSRPSLLNRISDARVGETPPSRIGLNGGASLSIKGAGQKQGRDEGREKHRRGRDNNRGPQYRGGYAR